MADSRPVIVKVALQHALVADPANERNESFKFNPGPLASLLEGRRHDRLFTRERSGDEIAHEFMKSAQSGGSSPDRRQFIRVIPGTAENSGELAAEFRKAPGVEMAYVEPTPVVPMDEDIDPGAGLFPGGPTQDHSEHQIHLRPAPEGLDAQFAWSIAGHGNAGRGVSGADVELGWILEHEDFGAAGRIRHVLGNLSTKFKDTHHGTACIGIGAATADARGVTGIAPDTDEILCFGVGPAKTPHLAVANAIEHACAALSAGDILLIELHAMMEGVGFFQPMEHDPAVYEAVKWATDDGRIVVAAAGNGAMDLGTTPAGMSNGDSGAILVGAGLPVGFDVPDRSRKATSNWGSRVNVQGYGSAVCTTGFGDLQGGMDGDPKRRYTKQFSGTSSATAMVWGACLLLQSIVKQRSNAVLLPREMRTLLETTGTPQADAPMRPRSQNIGPRPNLRAALEQLQLA